MKQVLEWVGLMVRGWMAFGWMRYGMDYNLFFGFAQKEWVNLLMQNYDKTDLLLQNYDKADLLLQNYDKANLRLQVLCVP